MSTTKSSSERPSPLSFSSSLLSVRCLFQERSRSYQRSLVHLKYVVCGCVRITRTIKDKVIACPDGIIQGSVRPVHSFDLIRLFRANVLHKDALKAVLCHYCE